MFRKKYQELIWYEMVIASKCDKCDFLPFPSNVDKVRKK
jgi:hypothetical protein